MILPEWRMLRLPAVALIAAGLTGAAAIASAASETGPGSPVTPIEGVTVGLAGEAPATSGGQSPYSLTLAMESDGKQLSDVEFTMWFSDAPLASSADLAAFLAGTSEVPMHQVAAATINTPSSPPGMLPAGLDTRTMLSAAPETLALGEAPGVYGVTVYATVGDKVIFSESTPLTYAPSRIPDINVAVVASIGGSPARVDALLDAAADPRVTLAVDPTALGRNAMGDTELKFMSDRELYILPAQGVDVTSVAHANTPQVLAAAVARSRIIHDAPWLAVLAAPDDVSVSIAQQEGASLALVDPRWAAPADPRTEEATGVPTVFTTDPGSGTPLTMVAPDPLASAALANSGAGQLTANAQVTAAVALAALGGATDIVVSPGTAWVVDAARPGRAVDLLFSSSFVKPIMVSDLLEQADPPVVDEPAHIDSTDDAIAADLNAIATVLGRMDALGQATNEPSAELDDARLALLRSAALDLRSDPQRRSLAAQEALTTARALIDSVAVTSGSSLLLVSSSGEVPITVANGLDVPVTVKVVLRSRSPILVTEGQPVVTIPAKSEATVTIPVTAVSSGDAWVSVALRTEDDTTLSVADSLRVSVHTAWGNAATGLFTVGLALLLAGGIWRTIRRGRKDTRMGPAEESSVAGGASTGA